MDFYDKVALVTGGSQGIGRALVSALLTSGMKVCICDIDEEATKTFMETLPLKENAIYQHCDVTSYDNFKVAFEVAVSHFGRIDLVVNNAGIHDEINWRKMIDVNIVGTTNGIKLGFEYMDKRKTSRGGDIINMASISGFIVRPPFPVYCATKHAVVGLTKGYGSDYHLEQTGVRVNAVCPTSVNTKLLEDIKSHDEGIWFKLYGNSKLLEPEDVAKALMQLLKDGKNGSLLHVDPSGMRYA